ncbi:hypothetical protein GHT07_09305 [Caenimonas koreensis DSM 17982]|uniref:TRAP transporter solute receptor, TAXI family n=1 Tax=Caenimonas koreensis DSM 17982 TaxID=1121255 RepID=A0A844B2N0_9BURK|nr:TAXI family TRAP transporter solute-binding subunit [Caenimonas koreensis]MRD47473.1 hypothetical protein [Caenimonas koreensis DSM 17982]
MKSAAMLRLYRQRWGLCYIPILLTCALAIWVAAHWIYPLPPKSLVLAAGVPQGGFSQMAEQYRDELERRGIAVDIVSSAAGALGPLQHLAVANDPVQAGFAHGLLAERGAEARVQALAVIGKQPVWVFTHQSGATSISQLRNLTIAAGPPGSATREVAVQLLAQAQVKPGEVTWDDVHQGMAAASELLEHRVDAMITIGTGDAPTIRLLSRSPGIHMLGLERADGLAAREPRLHPFILPQGAIELRGDVPPRDLTMLYTSTNLLVRETMHPALQRAMLDAASDIHSVPTFLQRLNEYPDYQSDFPLSPTAQLYATGQRPWLETALPYWWAQLAGLLLYAVLPILLFTGAALVWIPRLFSLRVDAVLAHYYGELNFLENDLEAAASEAPIKLKGMLGKLDRMEQEVASLDLPDRFSDRWYTLREHLVDARERLLKLRSR